MCDSFAWSEDKCATRMCYRLTDRSRFCDNSLTQRNGVNIDWPYSVSQREGGLNWAIWRLENSMLDANLAAKLVPFIRSGKDTPAEGEGWSSSFCLLCQRYRRYSGFLLASPRAPKATRPCRSFTSTSFF